MTQRFLIIGLDENLRRQVSGDLKIAFPEAEVESGSAPTDSTVVATYAAFSVLLVGYDHEGGTGENRECGPDALLTSLRGCGAPVLLLARGGNEMTAVDCVRAGAADYIPVRLISPPLLAARVRAALQARGAPGVERRRSQVRRSATATELPAAINGYRVQQTLAESDRSAVYLAYSNELRRNVALKCASRHRFAET
jgi:DNA-binding NtrC family response regulator